MYANDHKITPLPRIYLDFTMCCTVIRQTFNVTVSSESCELPASFEIKNVGSQENLTVELTALCQCECEDPPDPEFCSYAGNPVCGKCR